MSSVEKASSVAVASAAMSAGTTLALGDQRGHAWGVRVAMVV
jgi:hypothetical protein